MQKKRDAELAAQAKSTGKEIAGSSSTAGKEVIAKGDCFACGKHGHTENNCPGKMVQLGLHLCVYGIPGLMFHSIHVELEEGEVMQQQISRMMTIKDGVATEMKIVRELGALFEGVELWTVKKLAPNSFLIVFPNKIMRKELTKFKKGFFFVTDDIEALVEDSNLDAESFETLTEIWVRDYGIPQWAKKEKVVRQIAFLVGEPLVVDKASLLKPNWVRIKVACKDPNLVGGVNNIYINMQGYHIRWEVEGEVNPNKPPRPPSSTDNNAGNKTAGNGGKKDNKPNDSNPMGQDGGADGQEWGGQCEVWRWARRRRGR
jgi:hypothetical protein